MTVKPTETASELIKDFIMVKLETLHDVVLLEVSHEKECVKKVSTYTNFSRWSCCINLKYRQIVKEYARLIRELSM